MQIHPLVVDQFNRLLAAAVQNQLTVAQLRQQMIDLISRQYNSTLPWATVVYIRLALHADQVHPGARDLLVPQQAQALDSSSRNSIIKTSSTRS